MKTAIVLSSYSKECNWDAAAAMGIVGVKQLESIERSGWWQIVHDALNQLNIEAQYIEGIVFMQAFEAFEGHDGNPLLVNSDLPILFRARVSINGGAKLLIVVVVGD